MGTRLTEGNSVASPFGLRDGLPLIAFRDEWGTRRKRLRRSGLLARRPKAKALGSSRAPFEVAGYETRP
jgi:hypothetical protein